MLRLAASLLLASFALSPAAPEVRPAGAPYTALYVFGDSYSDTGAGYAYADGPTAVAYLAQRLGLSFTYYGAPDAQAKSLNFAVSGARTGYDAGQRHGTHILFSLGMRNQVEQFAALVSAPATAKTNPLRFDPAKTLFFLAGGLNDRGTPSGYTRSNEEDEIDALYALGARRFLVALLPTQIPAFASAGTQLNPEIARIPEEERARHPDIRIAVSHWGPFFDEVITNPAKYGLTDTTHACAVLALPVQTAPACATPATHFYYYAAHPSAAAHRAVGEMLYAEALAFAQG